MNMGITQLVRKFIDNDVTEQDIKDCISILSLPYSASLFFRIYEQIRDN